MQDKPSSEKSREQLIFILVFALICGFAISIGIWWNAASPSKELSAVPALATLEVKVHVKGEVKNPGIYNLPAESRVEDAIQMAGGATENANVDGVNLAAYVKDGYEIKVPAKSAASKSTASGSTASKSTSSRSSTPRSSSSASKSASTSTGKSSTANSSDEKRDTSEALPSLTNRGDESSVNINTASAAQLCGVGISSADASAIVAFRDQFGPYAATSDLLNVVGFTQQEYLKVKNRLSAG